MAKKKPTLRKLKAWAKEERQASKEYASYGFKRISNDEARHAEFFKGMIEREVNKKSRSAKSVLPEARRQIAKGGK